MTYTLVVEHALTGEKMLEVEQEISPPSKGDVVLVGTSGLNPEVHFTAMTVRRVEWVYTNQTLKRVVVRV